MTVAMKIADALTRMVEEGARRDANCLSKTRSVFDRYNVVNEHDLAEAAFKLKRRLARAEKTPAKATFATVKNQPA